MKKNKRHLGIYMLTAVCLLIGAIGGVTAYENRPDGKVPDLQLTVGQSGYDLMAGITYDSEKYTLAVEDTGGLDINRIGKYQVTYALTPLEVPSTEEIPETTEVPSTEVFPDTTEVPSTETVPGQTPDQTQPPSTETAPGTTPDQTGTPDTGTPDAGTTPDQSGTPDTGTPGAGTSPDQTETPDAGATSGTTTDKTDKTNTPASGTVTNDPLGGELEEAQPEDNSGASAKPTDISAVAESIFGTVSAAEITDTQTEGVKYLARTVWVVAGTDSIFIGYEEEDVKIRANEALYELVLIENETEQTTDTEPSAQMEQSDVTGEAGTQTETAVEPEVTEATEATGPQYELVLKKPELLTEGIRVTDSAASLYNGATVTVTDDSELKNAVNIETAEDGTKTIKSINFGTYTIEVTAEDQSTGKKASCTRTVTVEGIRFDAPTLYIGTQNTEYDITADMSAVDESGNNAEIYVINEDELTAARETVTDAETGEEKTQFIKGTYHVTLGAKHPVTGEEFTIDREVQVVEGYYIYAPALEIVAGTTDYDLTEGVELRSADTDETVADAKIMVEDMSDLERGITEETAFFGAKENIQTASEEITDEDTINIEGTGVPYEAVMPALAEGEYTVTLAAVNPDDEDNTITVQRYVRAVPRAETAFQDLDPTMTFEATAYGDRLTDPNVKSGQIAYIGGGLLYLNEYYDEFLNSTSKKRTFIRGKLLDSDNYRVTSWSGTENEHQRSWKAQIYTKTYQTSYYDGYILGRVELGDTGLIKKIGAEVKYDFVMDRIRKLSGLTDFSKLPDVDRYYTSFDTIMLPTYKAGEYIQGSQYSYVASYTAHSVYNGPVFPDNYTGITLTNDYIKREKGDWNQFIGSGGRTKQTLKEGGEPDITVEINKDINLPDISIDDLPDMVNNITPQSSILIKGNGKSVYTEGAGGVYYPSLMRYMEVPKMQLEWRNLNLKFNSSNAVGKYLDISLVTDDAYLKFTDVDIDNNIATAIKGGVTYANSNLKENQGTFIGENIGGNYEIYNLKDVKLIQNGEKDNTITVGFERFYAGSNKRSGVTVENLELDVNNGTMESYGMKAENTLLLKGDKNTIKLKTMQNNIQLPFKQPVINTQILDVQTADATVLFDKTNYGDESQFEITGKHLSNERQITVGKSDDALFKSGDKIAIMKAANGQLDATDFKCKYEDKLQYTVNSGLRYVIIKQLTTKSILVQQLGMTDQQFDSYSDAFDWILANGNGGAYTVKNLVPRKYDKADQDKLLQIQKAKASKITFEAANGSTIDNGYMRMRVANELEVMELPRDVDIEFKNIALRRSEANGLNELPIKIAKNGGTLTMNTGYKTVGDQCDLYGGSSVQDCTSASAIIANDGIFQNIYGGGTTGHSHTGNVDITVSGNAIVQNIDGATEGETVKPAGRNALITLSRQFVYNATPQYDTSIKNVYNYDKLTVNSTNVTISNEIISDKMTQLENIPGAGYQGETVFNGGMKLTLSKADAKRQLGSIKMADSATTNGFFLFAKPSGDGNIPTKVDNPAVITLTAVQPVNGPNTNANAKVSLNYDRTNVALRDDVVLYLPNANNSSDNVNTTQLHNGFGTQDKNWKNIKLMPNPATNTIVLRGESVGLSVGTSNTVQQFMSLKLALDALEILDNQTKGQNYRITFFADGYVITDEDRQKMDVMKTSGANEITWTSLIDENGRPIAAGPNKVTFSGDISFFGKKNMLKDIRMFAGEDTGLFAEGRPFEVQANVTCERDETASVKKNINIYGGGRLEGTSTSAVVVQSGTFGTIYGGGTKAQTGASSIQLSGGTAAKIYGGGKGTAGMLTGDTVINVDGGDVTGSIYGGGHGAKVKGTTAITYSVDNTKAAKVVALDTISGCGTGDAGDLIEEKEIDPDITARNITIKNKGTVNTGSMQLKNLTGFDSLSIGNSDATTNDKAGIQISGRFDSRVTDSQKNNRQDTVTLYSASLALVGDVKAHIGQLKTDGECLLIVPRKNGVSVPLKVDNDGNVIDQASKLKLAVLDSTLTDQSKAGNQIGDNVITFMNKDDVPADEYKKYRDGLNSRLGVAQIEDGDVIHIYFSEPKAHVAGGWVEYPDENKRPDKKDNTGQPVKTTKDIYIVYDKMNEHEVRTEPGKPGGYIIAMPKGMENDPASTVYTTTDDTFKTSGSFGSAVNVLNPYPLTFAYDTTDIEAGAVVHSATAKTNIPDIDNTKYWYILHTVCAGGDASVTLLDLDAPKEKTAMERSYDSSSGMYTFELKVRDTVMDETANLPSKKPGDANAAKYKLPYTPNGITDVYWTTGNLEGTDLAAADEQAVKKHGDNTLLLEQDAAKAGLHRAELSNEAGAGNAVEGGFVGKVVIKVPKSVVDANNTGALWVYAKDGVNNTMRFAIPLNDNIINVQVPMQVNVVAVKNTDTNATTELLTPVCYVKNLGTNKIETRIAGFVTTEARDTELRLVDKNVGDTFAPDEIALFVKGTENSVMNPVNVKSIGAASMPLLGTLHSAADRDGRTLAYTFDAAYNVQKINIPGGFIGNSMSYHFKAVQ